ncbi:MAG: regulatory protein RecX [Burkholderiales bacterium]
MKPRGAARPLASLRARGVQWLGQREHSASELRQKLLRHARVLQAAALAQAGEHPAVSDEAPDWPTAVEDALTWLTAQGYLSDARFVQSRVHVRAPRFGNLRIRQELAQHQLELAPEAALALQASEIDRARAVCRRKFPDPPQTAAESAKQARFLAQRGFSADVVRRVLRDAAKNQRNAITEDDTSP